MRVGCRRVDADRVNFETGAEARGGAGKLAGGYPVAGAEWGWNTSLAANRFQMTFV